MRVSAIITAAGLGQRFGGALPKQFALLDGRPVLFYSIEAFSKSELIEEIVLVVPENWVSRTQKEIVEKFCISKVTKILPGGAERQDSVERGFLSLSGEPEIVAVHDGVRPLVTVEIIEAVIEEASKYGAAVAALPSRDTIKKSSPDGFVDNTVPRDSLWFAQTPQAFGYDILKNAYMKASEDGFTATDESLLVERTGVGVRIVEGSPYNIKITTPEDLRVGEAILKLWIHEKSHGQE